MIKWVPYRRKYILIGVVLLITFFQLIIICNNPDLVSNKALFRKISSEKTNLQFTNTITQNDSFNLIVNEYVYMGCGVGIGDINNDGLPFMPNQHKGGVSISIIFSNKKLETQALNWHYLHYCNQGGAPCAVLRMGKWKLIEWLEKNAIELFDLEKDMEKKSYVAKYYPDVTNKLLQKLHDRQKKETDLMPTINPNATSIGKSEVANPNNSDTGYLAEVINELRKTWPKNRLRASLKT